MPSTMDDAKQLAREEALAAGQAEALDAEADDEYDEYEYAAPGRRFLLFAAVPSWAISMIVHIIAFLVLALMTIEPSVEKEANILNVANADVEEVEVEEFEMLEELAPLQMSDISAAEPVVQNTVDTPSEVVEVEVSNDVDAAAIHIDLADFSTETAPRNDLMKEIGSIAGSALEGRMRKARGQMVKQNGGSEGSEKSVAMALKYFAAHQFPDGRWSFEDMPCSCTHQGATKGCYTGATAMALLPFLGSGQTHMEGKYKDTVGRGLAYLIRNEKPNGSLVQGGGSMYAHGLASIALCEAYAMTHDRKLMAPAQASLAFISYAQDPVGGGWRYLPRQPGDTSVVGWQLMALKSGHMAYLQVPPNTVAGAIHFLNTVQTDGGARYGYKDPIGKPSTTAIGLLCRMYLGWKKDNPALQRGAAYISKLGPSKTDHYYNYYATQIMHHYGDEYWPKWNKVMRDQLVNSQVKTGHSAGSWDVPGPGHANERGGRLYVTSMATMILEVYYRHMPIYAKEAAEEDFPL